MLTLIIVDTSCLRSPPPVHWPAEEGRALSPESGVGSDNDTSTGHQHHTDTGHRSRSIDRLSSTDQCDHLSPVRGQTPAVSPARGQTPDNTLSSSRGHYPDTMSPARGQTPDNTLSSPQQVVTAPVVQPEYRPEYRSYSRSISQSSSRLRSKTPDEEFSPSRCNNNIILSIQTITTRFSPGSTSTHCTRGQV